MPTLSGVQHMLETVHTRGGGGVRTAGVGQRGGGGVSPHSGGGGGWGWGRGGGGGGLGRGLYLGIGLLGLGRRGGRGRASLVDTGIGFVSRVVRYGHVIAAKQVH